MWPGLSGHTGGRWPEAAGKGRAGRSKEGRKPEPEAGRGTGGVCPNRHSRACEERRQGAHWRARERCSGGWQPDSLSPPTHQPSTRSVPAFFPWPLELFPQWGERGGPQASVSLSVKQASAPPRTLGRASAASHAGYSRGRFGAGARQPRLCP